MKRNIARKLRKEREKLGRLVDKALKKGTPLSQDKKIIKHSEKADRIINDDMERRNSM